MPDKMHFARERNARNGCESLKSKARTLRLNRDNSLAREFAPLGTNENPGSNPALA